MKKDTIFIGILEGVFGYGFAVVGRTRDECRKAMKQEFKKWKAQYRPYGNEFKTFEKCMDYMGGYVMEAEIGKVYFDSFKQ